MAEAVAAPGEHRVVVIGSGFGGLFATQALAREPVRVTLVSATAHHLFQPLLYQVATGILSPGEIAPATRAVLRHQRNAQVLLGSVTDVDLDAREVVSTSELGETRTPYDSLVVAAGSTQSYFGHDEFARHAPGMKSVDDALELRGRILGAFELAELAEDPAERERLLTFVVVGGGPTGVEMAGQIAELAHRSLRGDFRRVDPALARVLLVDAAATVLPGFDERLRRSAARRLQRMGVEVRTGVTVAEVDADGVTLATPDGERQRVPSRCTVWAAGVAAAPLAAVLAERSGAGRDRAGRLLVEPDCTLPGHPEVFVVGDMMALHDLPGVAQVAMQSGEHAARAVAARARGQAAPGPFRYRDKGSMATVSRFHAVAQVGRLAVTGFPAWVLWLVVHLIYLVGFKNRFTTLVHWTVSFVGRSRSERTVTAQQVLARQVLADRAAEQAAEAGGPPTARA